MMRHKDEEDLAKFLGAVSRLVLMDLFLLYSQRGSNFELFFSQQTVDLRSSTNMVEVIKQKIGQTEAFPHFLSILQHFLLFPSECYALNCN